MTLEDLPWSIEPSKDIYRVQTGVGYSKQLTIHQLREWMENNPGNSEMWIERVWDGVAVYKWSSTIKSWVKEKNI